MRRRDLQDFADELHAAGLSGATISNVLNPIQAYYRRAIDRDELTYNPSERIDLPIGHSKRPKRIASREEAAALLDALDPVDRLVWATAFYAGLRRGELQALRVCDLDFEANVIAVERGWDQVEGVIEPKSAAGRRTVPLLAVLRDYLEADLQRSGRSGEDLVFGRTTEIAFYASTIDHRAKQAWKRANKRVTEEAEQGGCAQPAPADHAPRVPSHLRLAPDRRGRQPEGDPAIHGPLEDPDHVRRIWPFAAGES
ncbi:MAG: tyrosine-type recombinase/integrase [Solirubrobacterales bacterium]